MNPRITTEVIEALALLRTVAYSEAIANAVDVLDNAGIFHLIDEATGYDIDPAPRPQTLVRTSKCTCSSTVPQVAAGNHFPNCPGDPAEWGDMAFRYVPAEQGETASAAACCEHGGMYHGARGCDHCPCTTPRVKSRAPRVIGKGDMSPSTRLGFKIQR